MSHDLHRGVTDRRYDGEPEFGKPVLLIYGDSHVFKVSRPFARTAPNLVALEVFGEADMHAVEVTVDTGDAAVFGFRPVYNPAQPLVPDKAE